MVSQGGFLTQLLLDKWAEQINAFRLNPTQNQVLTDAANDLFDAAISHFAALHNLNAVQKRRLYHRVSDLIREDKPVLQDLKYRGAVMMIYEYSKGALAYAQRLR